MSTLQQAFQFDALVWDLDHRGLPVSGGDVGRCSHDCGLPQA